MDLVVGGTGYLGSAVCRRLVEGGREVAALVRPGQRNDPRQAELRALGVTLVEGDLKDPASLAAACAGIATIVSTASATLSSQAGNSIKAVDLDGQRDLIDAAAAAGVSQFVYISFSKNMDTPCPLTSAKREIERHLQAGGMGYTILRCSFFMEIMLSLPCGFDVLGGSAILYGTGEDPISWVSIEDVARLVLMTLEDPAARSAVVEFGGLERLTMREVVRVFEQASGKSWTTQVVPEEMLRAQMEEADDDVVQSKAAVMVNYAHGDAVDMTETAQRFPVRTTSVREYADRAVQPIT
jgi:uncharacterized protein YbjT (DUF2867 family)